MGGWLELELELGSWHYKSTLGIVFGANGPPFEAENSKGLCISVGAPS